MAKQKIPYLTKSRFMAGLDCHKRLWLSFHAPLPYTDPEPGSIQAIGTEVGILAHQLFPGGILVDQKPWEHQEAIERTQYLMSDVNVPAIFEGSFEYDGVRVRCDVIERLPKNKWRLYEVKSSKQAKEPHYPDLAIQAHVMSNNDIKVTEIGLLHINGDYVRGPGGLDCEQLFARTDLTQGVQEWLPDLPDQIREFHDILARGSAPEIEPGKHCPSYCDFLDQCTANKSKDWLFHMPNLRADKYDTLVELGHQRIGQIPDDFKLSDLQARVRDVHKTGNDYLSPALSEALEDFGPPAYYLDFETLGSAIPVYPGTRPFQRIPFQWSIHHLDHDGNLTHQEFLPEDSSDPRRPLAEAMIKSLGNGQEPIVVYTSYEAGVIRDLAYHFPDLAQPLNNILDRLQDLHKLVRDHFYQPDFGGSFSIKAVGPAMVPDLGYDQLEGIAEGMAAAGAFYALATDQLQPDQDPAALRQALLDYCKLDSLAMFKVHQALIAKVGN